MCCNVCTDQTALKRLFLILNLQQSSLIKNICLLILFSRILLAINKKMILGKWKFSKVDKNFVETKNLNINSQYAKKKLNWNANLTFEKRMKLTAEWYYAFINNKKIITLDQIRNFLKNYR